jgi:hypothetical protein
MMVNVLITVHIRKLGIVDFQIVGVLDIHGALG